MALTTCPECRQSVSDPGARCPYCGFPLAALHRQADPSVVAPVAEVSTGPFLLPAMNTVGLYLVALPLTLYLLVAMEGGDTANHSQVLKLLLSGGYWTGALLSALPLALLLTTPVQLFSGRIHPLNVLLTIVVNSLLVFPLILSAIAVVLLLFNLGPLQPVHFWIASVLWLLLPISMGINYATERNTADRSDMVGFTLYLMNVILWFAGLGVIFIALFTQIIISRHHIDQGIASSTLNTAIMFATIPWLTATALFGFLRFTAGEQWKQVSPRLRADHPNVRQLFQSDWAKIMRRSRSGKV
ncbi:MAG: hypothetical protein JWL77_4867 [Chthonomonadaceae bacterium]|nr:hypothetical protein [Chthonomonadaceae bacterium]